MQTFRRIRRSIAAVLLMLYLPGCYHWHLGYLGPSDLTNETVRVTDSAGKHLWLYKPWVSGDSLVGRRLDNSDRVVSRDTIGIPMAHVVQVKVGKYRGTIDPATTVPRVVTGANDVRVITATDTLRLAKPWATGDSLFGYRVAKRAGKTDTIAVALEAIRHLDTRQFNNASIGYVTLGVLAVGVAVLAIACNSSGADCLHGWGY